MARNDSNETNTVHYLPKIGSDALLSVLKALPELAFILSEKGKYLEVFGGNEDLLYTTSNKFLGKTVFDILPLDKAKLIHETINISLNEKRNVTIEYDLEVPAGLRLFEAGVAPFEHPDFEQRAVVLFARDITAQRQEEERLRFLAFHDSLTNLPNRRQLESRLEEENARCLRHEKFSALLFIDLDDFKEVNDCHGHSAGDSVLIEIAHRLSQFVRADDFVCRLAGDEFVVVLSLCGENLKQAQINALDTANALLSKLSKGIELDSFCVKVQASIGISFLPSKHEKAKVIIHEADSAMYKAKLKGKGLVAFNDD